MGKGKRIKALRATETAGKPYRNKKRTEWIEVYRNGAKILQATSGPMAGWSFTTVPDAAAEDNMEELDGIAESGPAITVTTKDYEIVRWV